MAESYNNHLFWQLTMNEYSFVGVHESSEGVSYWLKDSIKCENKVC